MSMLSKWVSYGLYEHRHMAPLWRKVREPLKQPAILKINRMLQGRIQSQALKEMVAESLVDEPVSVEEQSRLVLEALAAKRRSFLGANGRPSVVAFGFEDWEKHGFWQSFPGCCDFRFVNFRTTGHNAGALYDDEASRQIYVSAVLDKVDELDRESSINVVFFYSDSNCLAPQLFEELAKRGIWSIVLGLDDKHRFFPRWERGAYVGQSTLIGRADLLWSTWPLFADRVCAAGGAGWYAPAGAHPSFHGPLNVEKDIDVLFLGQRYGKRAELVEGLRQYGVKVYAAGRGWSHGFVSFDESIALINRARIVIGHGATGQMDDVRCLKGRDIEIPMCGAVYLTSYNPELTECYVLGREILCYSTLLEAVELIRAVLGSPARQRAIGAAARARCLADHTWERRIRDMFALFPT